jgi:hypothetical protein
MLLLHPDLFDPDINRLLRLLEFHLNTGGLPLIVDNPFVGKLVDAGFVTRDGFLNHELLANLLLVIDDQELYGAIPKEAGGKLLDLLAKIGPEDAMRMKEIIRQVVERNPMGDSHTRAFTVPTEPAVVKSGYAVELVRQLEMHPLDGNWVSAKACHVLKPERLVFKLMKDLATTQVIEKLSANDACVARWNLYQELLQDENFQPSAALLKQAGLEQSSLPALRAHRSRSGLHLIPSQFILHIGKQVLRVAVFSAVNQHNESAFQQLRVCIEKMGRPAEVRLATGKTFQLDVAVKAPADLAPGDLKNEIHGAWGKIRSVLEKL